MRNARVCFRLLLEEEFYVLLLERKRERKVLDCERDLLGIVVEP